MTSTVLIPYTRLLHDYVTKLESRERQLRRVGHLESTKKGWRWQRNRHDTYCIVIENRLVEDNFKMD
jgi:hypothetical protein